MQIVSTTVLSLLYYGDLGDFNRCCLGDHIHIVVWGSNWVLPCVRQANPLGPIYFQYMDLFCFITWATLHNAQGLLLDALWDHSWCSSGDHRCCRGLNLGWLCAKPVQYLLYCTIANISQSLHY